MPQICTVCLTSGTVAVQSDLLDIIYYKFAALILRIICIHQVRKVLSTAKSLLTICRAQDALSKYSEHPGRLQKRLRICISICTGCVLISTVIVVMEVYTLLALQFCDGEDLMSLYWSTWTMIQLGSLIAMVGVILAMVHTLRNKRHP